MNKKSQIVSLLLTLVFGPIGILYSSAIAALLCMIAMFLAVSGGPLGFLMMWFVSIIVGAVMVEKRNQETIRDLNELSR